MQRWRFPLFLLASLAAVPALGQGYFPVPEIPEMIGQGSLLADPAAPPAAEQLVFEAAPVTPLPPPPKIWSGSLDAGINGSEGNSQVFNFRLNAALKRETDRSILDLKLNSVNTASNGTTTANRLFFDGRNEWKLGASPWTLYAHETTEYDKFRAFDVRVTGDAGIGYRFIKNDCTTLAGRFGPGASREFGGPDNQINPELVFGGTFDHQISPRQKISLVLDYFPNATDFLDYRINSQFAWTFLLDEANNLSLKLSLVDRYDSTPHGALPNDLDYAATILWQF